MPRNFETAPFPLERPATNRDRGDRENVAKALCIVWDLAEGVGEQLIPRLVRRLGGPDLLDPVEAEKIASLGWWPVRQ